MRAAAAAVLLLASPASAAGPAAHACTLEGWSVDPDPTGLRVRAAPDVHAPELGRLPAFVADPDGGYGPAFLVTAAQNGWLWITDARDSWRPSDLPRRAVFPGSGWVHGSRVRLAIQSAQGRAGPSDRAALVVDSGRDWLTDVGAVTGVLDCTGRWVRVSYTLPAGRTVRGARSGTAWFTDTCGDQRTTCDQPAHRS